MQKKSFGQHFLHDQGVLSKIADAVPVDLGPVVEVGPGEGALTRLLLEKIPIVRFRVIEADRELIPGLSERFPGLMITLGDAARVPFPETESWVLVGNLPYNAAAAILAHAYQGQNPPEKAIVMVQKEQAQRMMAKPGKTSLLSLAIQLYSTPKKLFDVGSGAFMPPPKVDSTVLELSLRRDRDPSAEAILSLARIGFGSRRKQLQRNLLDHVDVTKEELDAAFSEAKIPPAARAQELSLDEWGNLYRALQKYKE